MSNHSFLVNGSTTFFFKPFLPLDSLLFLPTAMISLDRFFAWFPQRRIQLTKFKSATTHIYQNTTTNYTLELTNEDTGIVKLCYVQRGNHHSGLESPAGRGGFTLDLPRPSHLLSSTSTGHPCCSFFFSGAPAGIILSKIHKNIVYWCYGVWCMDVQKCCLQI